MQGYIIRRILALIPTLIFASLIVFITIRLMPGNIIDLMLSQNDVSASKQTREQLEAALGLDTPIYIQYFKWIGALVFKGSLGNSLWTNTPVMEEILYRLPITFELGFMALIVALIVGIPIGVYAALKQDTHRRLRSAHDLDPGARHSRLLDRNAGDGVPVDLVGMVALGEIHNVRAGPDGPSAADCSFRRLILGKAFSAIIMRLDANADAGSAAPGLHPYGEGEGSRHGHDRHAPCACATR